MRNIHIIFIVFLLAACSSKKSEEVQVQPATESFKLSLTDAQLKQAELLVSLAMDKVLHETVNVTGLVDVPPQSMVSVSFPLGGYLKTTQLLPGMSVRKGEVIAVMEDQSYVQLQQDYLVDKAKMEYLSADLERQKELSEHEAASKKNYQQVLSEYKVIQVMIKGMEEKLRIIGIDPARLSVNAISRSVSVKSPISGFVTKVNVNIGKYVNPSDVLFELVNPNDIHAALTVFEKDMPAIQKGMKARVSLANNPSKKYTVEVLLATKNIDENRTGLVHCHFVNANRDLLPGMFLNGYFELAGKTSKVVPEETVIRYEGKQYVFVSLNDHEFEMVEVQTGTSQQGMISLKENNKIDFTKNRLVVKNGYRLLGMLKNIAE